MSANGAFVQSLNGAFTQSLNGERGPSGVAPPFSADLFVACNYLLSNPGQMAIEIFGFNAGNGNNQSIRGYLTGLTAQPGTRQLRLWGFEKVGNFLYLVAAEEVDEVLGLFDVWMDKITLDGTLVLRRLFAEAVPEFDPASNVCVAIGRGFYQDSDEEPVSENLIGSFLQYSQVNLATASPSLQTMDPGTLANTTPIDGLGASYASDPIRWTVGAPYESRFYSFYNDAVAGAGVRYIFRSESVTIRHVQGTVGFVEGTTINNPMQRVTQVAPYIYSTTPNGNVAYISNASSVAFLGQRTVPVQNTGRQMLDRTVKTLSTTEAAWFSFGQWTDPGTYVAQASRDSQGPVDIDWSVIFDPTLGLETQGITPLTLLTHSEVED